MTAPTEREVLEALWDRADMRGYAIRARFTAMLDAGAYESAALMMVPAGYNWSLDNIGGRCGAVLNGDPSSRHAIVVDAKPTPALALCAAIEAALAREGE